MTLLHNTNSIHRRSSCANPSAPRRSRAPCATRSTRRDVRGRLFMPRTERPRRVRLTAAVAIVLATTVAVPVHAQGGVLLQGIVDGEAWSTSATSNLLTRAGGHPAGLGRITAWGAWEPFRAFVLYA